MNLFELIDRLLRPRPDGWDEWSDLAKELWDVLNASRFDISELYAVLERHADEIVRNATQSLAAESGAAHEAEFYG